MNLIKNLEILPTTWISQNMIHALKAPLFWFWLVQVGELLFDFDHKSIFAAINITNRCHEKTFCSSKG